MYMRDFVLWIARWRSTCLYTLMGQRTNTAKLNWLVYNVGSYGIIAHSLSDRAMCCVVQLPYRLPSNSRSGWVTA